MKVFDAVEPVTQGEHEHPADMLLCPECQPGEWIVETESGSQYLLDSRVLAEVSSSLLGPRTGECLLCYVHRMLTDHGCDCRLRFATHYRDVRAPRATALERRLQRVGGFCDCEIFLNGYEPLLPLAPGDLDEDDAEAERARPDPMPTCPGLRAGSTRPCALWLSLIHI